MAEGGQPLGQFGAVLGGMADQLEEDVPERIGVHLPAPLEAVWDAIVAGEWLGTDVEIDARPGGALRVDTRVGVVEAAEPGRSLSFWWTTPDRDEPASRVDVEIQRVGDITRLWVREVQLDLDVRAMLRAPSALARA